MMLIVGLGNPGKQYEQTRHNLGFRVLDLLIEEDWENKYDSQFLKLDDVILAKPQTFMNKSGEAVKEILKFYPAAELVVIHDDLDLPLGSIKVQKDISGAGHNGVQSIIDEIGTKNFIRIRLGIENRDHGSRITDPDQYVLQKFREQEEMIVKEVLEKAKAAVEILQTQGLDIAQSRFNG